jgi:hypothetical protein
MVLFFLLPFYLYLLNFYLTMTLTNCSRCKYLDRHPHHSSDIICSLNPAYASMWTRLRCADDYTLSILPIDDCTEFTVDSAFEEKKISLSLTFTQWHQLIRLTRDPSYQAYILQALANLDISVVLTPLPMEQLKQWQTIADSSSLIAPLLAILEQEGILPRRDPWVHVDSSCIDAIAFDSPSSTLKIRFNSGDIYQYSDFPHDLYLDFCDADSKGRFFNQVVKDEYDFVRL